MTEIKLDMGLNIPFTSEYVTYLCFACSFIIQTHRKAVVCRDNAEVSWPQVEVI